MAAITKVPNGPLIKKKGPFKGSTLKSGGTVKKAQEGATMSPYMQKRAAQQLVKEKNIRARDSILNRNANAKGMTRAEVQAQQERDKNKPDVQQEGLQIGKACKRGDTKGSCSTGESNKGESLKDTKRNGGPIKKAQFGNLIKKAVKKTTKEIIPVAEKNLTRTDAAYNKKGLNMAIERRVNPEAAKKKMTKAQRRSFEVDDSYRRNGGPVKKAKAGAMIKRADGSFSKRGLWDNIRANKGSGKKPTKQMLVQEKKIKAKSKK